jgi:hypothetical protein
VSREEGNHLHRKKEADQEKRENRFPFLKELREEEI